MTRSGHLPRAQDRSVHLTSGLDLFRSGQNFFFCDFPQTMRGVFKPHNSLRLFVFLGKMSVLLALSAKPPCPSGRCQRIATAMRRKPLMDMSQDLMESPLKKGEANMQPHPLGGLLPTPTPLKGLRIKPTACHRSFRLRWWSGWHRGVLRGFAGWGVVLLALSAKRPCLLSRYQHMGTELMCRQNITVKGPAIVNGLIPRPEVHLLRAVPSPTAIRLKGVRSKPTTCRRSFRLRWWSGWHRGILRGFAGGVWVLLALSAKRRCPRSRRRVTRIPRRGS